MGGRLGTRTARHSRARPSPNTSFPRRREPTPTRAIPLPEEAAWWVAVTGTVMTAGGERASRIFSP